MKKFLKELSVWLLMFSMVFAMVYIITLTADAMDKINKERERAYFDRIEEMRK